MEHGNAGLLAVRGWTPWPTGGWRPYPYFTKPTVNLGGQLYGGHYHVWGSVWEAYAARDNSGDVAFTQVDLQVGSPPATLAIGTASDVTGTPYASTALVAHGYQFVSFGKYVLVAGDETVEIQSRDSTGASVFANAIDSGSIDKPSGRYMAVAGGRIVLGYILHNSTTSRDNYESDALTDETLIVFSGLRSGFSYFSTINTSDSGSNDWDEEERADKYPLVDELGVITGIATTAHGFGWVWKENGVYRFDFQQTPVDFRLISDQHGTRSPRSIVVVDDTAYWYDQLGHLCRSGGGGEVEDLSSTSVMTALLDDDAISMGRFSEHDLTQGKNSAEATAFVYGATEPWRCTVDLETILGGTGVHRYPQGFFDAHSETVRWIYPSTYTQMEGLAGAPTSTTLTRTLGTLFDHSDNSFMDDRTIVCTLDNAATHTTTVSSVTSREVLELAVATPSAMTAKLWKITFQRYMELVFQPRTQTWAATDVTHAWDKHASLTPQRPWGMHWGISSPGFGLRLTQTASQAQRLAYAPRDVLYGFIYLTTSGTDFYSLTYAWPYGEISGVDQGGYLLLEDNTFITDYLSLQPDQVGSVPPSTVRGIRPVYTPRQRALDLGADITLSVVILTKRRAGANRDSSGNVQGPLVQAVQSFALDQAAMAPGNTSTGYLPLTSEPGTWHQLVIYVQAGPFTANDPVNAFEVISSIDYFDVKLSPAGGP